MPGGSLQVCQISMLLSNLTERQRSDKQLRLALWLQLTPSQEAGCHGTQQQPGAPWLGSQPLYPSSIPWVSSPYHFICTLAVFFLSITPHSAVTFLCILLHNHLFLSSLILHTHRHAWWVLFCWWSGFCIDLTRQLSSSCFGKREKLGFQWFAVAFGWRKLVQQCFLSWKFVSWYFCLLIRVNMKRVSEI